MSWYNNPTSDKGNVISSGVTILRNLTDFPFSAGANAKSSGELLSAVGSLLESNGFGVISFAEISPGDAVSYAEKRYISPEFAGALRPHALYINQPCNLAVSVGGTEQISIRCNLPGVSFSAAYNNACKVEEIIDSKFSIAFSDKLGYLTCDPSELGIAMHACAVVFLPSLTECDQISPLAHSLLTSGFELREMYGGHGDLFELTSTVTLGISENELLDTASDVIEKLISAEEKASKLCDAEGIADRAFRSLGILRSARKITCEETLECLGFIRRGVICGAVTDIDAAMLNTLTFESLPATLSLICGGHEKLDRSRAEHIQKSLTNQE